MGSFPGHAIPGSLFLLVGAWHVWSAARRHAADPRGFRVRAWSPAAERGRWRHAELYAVAAGAFADLLVEVVYATRLRWFADGELNPKHMNNFEHGAMLLLFFVYGAVAVAAETTRFLPLPEGSLCLVGAVAFTGEMLLFAFHSTTHTGLEGYYHVILVILIGLCVATAVLAALFPTSLALDLGNGTAIMLQGLWFYQTAFVLYGPMMPHGCHLDVEESKITCHSGESEVRGELFANFQLFSLVFLAFVYMLGCYAVSAIKFGHPELKRMHEAELASMCGKGGAETAALPDDVQMR